MRPGLACGKLSAPVSAASAQPRSGSARRAEIIGHQPQLVVARGLVGEAVQQFGEAVHASASPLAGFFVLLAIADDIERPRLEPARDAPVHQRILLAVRDPDLAGAGRGDGRGEAVPIGVIGNHQRQFDAMLARPRAHPHPARRERGDRIGEAPRPELVQRRRRTERDGAGELRPCPRRAPAAIRRARCRGCVIARDLLHRAVQIDRRVVAGLAQQRDHALRLAERIGADEMRALGKQRDRAQQLGDLAVGIAVAEHRQREGRLGDEHVARHQLERRAGRIGDVLVVAGGDDAQARRPRPRSAPSRARGRRDGTSPSRRRA